MHDLLDHEWVWVGDHEQCRFCHHHLPWRLSTIDDIMDSLWWTNRA